MAERWWRQWDGMPESWRPTETQAARQRFYLPWFFLGLMMSWVLRRVTADPIALAFLIVWGIAGIVMMMRTR